MTFHAKAVCPQCGGERDARSARCQPCVWSTPVERFWSKVDKSGDCWIWTGARAGRAGELYGFTRWGGGEGKAYAHRVAYELIVGPIPAGLQIDHLCRHHLCVNPAHLEPVTNRENCIRGVIARKTGRAA